MPKTLLRKTTVYEVSPFRKKSSGIQPAGLETKAALAGAFTNSREQMLPPSPPAGKRMRNRKPKRFSERIHPFASARELRGKGKKNERVWSH